MEKQDSVYDALKKSGMPLTPHEILTFVTKSRGSAFKEINSLLKHKMIVKFKIQYDEDARKVRILYQIKKD